MPEESLRPSYEKRSSNLTISDTKFTQILEDKRFAKLVDADYTLAKECKIAL